MKRNKSLNILFIGDIVGRPGRRSAAFFISEIKKEKKINLVLANGENLSSGRGMTIEKYEEMAEAGVDYFTSGNHIWDNQAFIPYLDRNEIKVIRPANYPSVAPGRGFAEIKVLDRKILLLNLAGRVFMKDDVDDPFVTGKNIIDEHPNDIVIIDFHAEATSEKSALGHYFDGIATAVLGTHTHVQTADEKILPGGTAFISDIGMCGPNDSVLGIKKDIIIEKFLTQLPKSHKVASGDNIFNAVIITIGRESRKSVGIERISRLLKA